MQLLQLDDFRLAIIDAGTVLNVGMIADIQNAGLVFLRLPARHVDDQDLFCILSGIGDDHPKMRVIAGTRIRNMESRSSLHGIHLPKICS
jgi:hypothetical protein